MISGLTIASDYYIYFFIIYVLPRTTPGRAHSPTVLKAVHVVAAYWHAKSDVLLLLKQTVAIGKILPVPCPNLEALAT